MSEFGVLLNLTIGHTVKGYLPVATDPSALVSTLTLLWLTDGVSVSAPLRRDEMLKSKVSNLAP